MSGQLEGDPAVQSCMPCAAGTGSDLVGRVRDQDFGATGAVVRLRGRGTVTPLIRLQRECAGAAAGADLGQAHRRWVP
jgi:hypothetical protein